MESNGNGSIICGKWHPLNSACYNVTLSSNVKVNQRTVFQILEYVCICCDDIIYPSIHSQVHISLTFTLLCNHHHSPFPEPLHLPKLQLFACSTLTPSHSPAASRSQELISCLSVNLATVVTAYKWNYKNVILCLVISLGIMFSRIMSSVQLMMSVSTLLNLIFICGIR